MSNSRQFQRQRGRSPGASFVQIPHFVLESAQWASMDPIALQLLMELVRQYRGNNNGDLSATPDSLGLRNSRWNSRSVLYGRLRWLEQHGWIVKTRQGGKHLGCCLYAVTFWPINACPEKHPCSQETKPSHMWRNANSVPPHGTRRTA